MPDSTDEVWIAACEQSLCAAYPPLLKKLVYQVQVGRRCEHAFCDGILDVLDRIWCLDWRATSERKEIQEEIRVR